MKEKKCLTCRKSYYTARKDKDTCSDPCRKKLQRKQKAKIQKENFSSTAFGKWVIHQCRHSRTTQILQSVEINSLYNLWARCNKYNGFNSGIEDRYCLSHICPVVNSNGVVALLHPMNLVISPTSYNASRGNSWDGKSGRYIPNESLDDSLTIFENDTTTRVEQLICKALGSQFDSFLESTKLAASANKRISDKLKKLDCPVKVSHHTEYQTLVDLLERYESHDYDDRAFGTPSTPSQFVYWEEGTRLGAFVDESKIFSESPNWEYLHTSYTPGTFAYVLEAKPDIDHETLLVLNDDGELVTISLETHHGTESIIEKVAYVPTSDTDRAEGVNSRSYRWPNNGGEEDKLDTESCPF